MLVGLVLLASGGATVAGCGGEKVPVHEPEVRAAGPGSNPRVRAQKVADAWDGSRAARTWREGFYPMGEAVRLPEDAWSDAADARAWKTQNFDLHGELHAPPRSEGRVKWGDGGSLTRPMMGVREAYEAVARGGSPEPSLTVTGARLGRMTLATSRGPATVPAWLFTLEGYDTPLKRVAVRPSRLPASPIVPVPGTGTDELTPLPRRLQASGDGRRVTVAATHGSCDDGPAVDVLETDGSVVLSASVAGGRGSGACNSAQHVEEVTVTLDRPLGDRVLLDAFTGRPVPYGKRNGPSPSWT